jgi:hypothetical protein
LFEAIVAIMLFASIFVWKPLKKVQCIHTVFLTKKHFNYAKICRGVKL